MLAWCSDLVRQALPPPKKREEISSTCSVISHGAYCSRVVLIMSGRFQFISHQGCFPTLIYVTFGWSSAACGDVSMLTNQRYRLNSVVGSALSQGLQKRVVEGKLFVSGLFARATCNVDAKLWPRSGDFPSLRLRNWTPLESNWSLSVAQLSHFGPFFFLSNAVWFFNNYDQSLTLSLSRYNSCPRQALGLRQSLFMP